MQHCDPDDLALLALGEDVDVDHHHLASCSQCAEELDALRSVVVVARSGQVEEVPPPPAVWAGIAAATGVSAVPRGTADSDTDTDDDARRRVREPAAPAPRAARGWPTWALAAAVLVGVLAGGGVVAAVTGGDAAPAGGPPLVAAELEPLVETAGTGSAELVDVDDRTVLRLSADSLPADEDGFYEVWLLDEQAQRMVPLGVLQGGTGEFAVPSGLDVGDYPVVDVSVEPYDGDPTHSGNSLLRGTLGT